MSVRAFHRQRPLVAIAMAFGCGLTLGIRWQQLLLWLPLSGAGLSLLHFFLCRSIDKPVVISLCLLALFGGVLWGNRAANPQLPPEGRYQVLATMEGDAERRQTDGRLKALLKDVTLSDEAGPVHSVRRAYFTWYPGEQDATLPQDGQRLSFSGAVYHPSPQQNPHGFDFRLYLLQKGIPIGLSGARDMTLLGEAHASPWRIARNAIAGLLDSAMGADSALSKALLIGDRDDLPEETRKDFQVTGIAHVLAVSGLHVSILVMGLSWLMRKAHLGPKVQFMVLAVFLFAYARLLDFSAPVVRAAILGILLLWGQAAHQRSDPLTGLAAAFVLILLARPMDLTNIGFQLSFAAVLGIILLGDRLEHLYSRVVNRRRMPGFPDRIIRAFLITLAAGVFTAPLVAFHFYQITPIGLLLSPLACLVVSWLMMASIAVLPIAALLLPAGQLLAHPAILLGRLLNGITNLAAQVEGGFLRVAAPSALLVLLCYAGMVVLSRYVRMAGKWRVGMTAAFAAAALVVSVLPQPQPLRWTQFSMGSADAAIVEDGESTYVVDAGTHGGDLAAYLHARGRAIDILFITHLHNDHVGGLVQLLEAGVRIGTIVLADGARYAEVEDNSHEILLMAEAAGIPISNWAAGDTLVSEQASMQVLWPERGKVYPGRDANMHCLTMLWSLNGYTLLTSGDLDGQYEMYSATPAQMLKLAHHGSKYSTSPGYLDAVAPQAALLSTSGTQLERAAEVLGRLEARGIPVYQTPAQGALIMTFGPEGPRIQGHMPAEGI